MSNPLPAGVDHEFDADHEHVSLTIGGARVRLSAHELETLSQHLGYLRASMVPEVPLDVPAGSCPTIDIPRLAVQSTPDGTRTAVGVRTPAFGWIALLLDRAQTEGLGAHLTTLAAAMKPDRTN
jgi:hypothetical protein